LKVVKKHLDNPEHANNFMRKIKDNFQASSDKIKDEKRQQSV
jgi:hypothetical protein